MYFMLHMLDPHTKIESGFVDVYGACLERFFTTGGHRVRYGGTTVRFAKGAPIEDIQNSNLSSISLQCHLQDSVCG